MGEDRWAELTERIPRFLEEEDAADAEAGVGWSPHFLQLRDETTGRHVHFAQQGADIEVLLPVPDDAADAERLLTVLREQPDDLWEPCPLPLESDAAQPNPELRAVERVWRRPQLARAWHTGWRRGGDATERRRVAASVVAVLRDGLDVTPEGLRCATWSLDTPGTATYGLPADRPTARDADPVCDGWADFEARLAWALTTLPWDSVLSLSTPHPGPDPCFVQFLHGRRLHNEASGWDVAGLGAAEFERRMSALGWTFAPQSGALIWEGPEANAGYHPRLAGTPQRTVATFREVFTVGHPQDLVFRAFRNGGRDDPDLAYLDRELGVPRDVR
ncbi:TY-Chap domain-containing protein [Nocardia sp. NPDC050406]|uniref:TY-Chap domain-containing protein n=1 Tax=Nocardia sp. NPDC050406 TaxID=3364318 RepID=UPI0037A33ECF